jgi:uncharacterized membrane protein YccC
MIQRTALVLAFLFCTTMLAPEARPAQDPTAIRSDLERMHILLSQMQKNAAFVSHGDTPLKQQFELEIEMCQVLLSDMEGKINAQGSR